MIGFRPPTFVDDFDLDSSIISVASISSEIADSHVFNMAGSFQLDFNSVSMIDDLTDLEDIQPPSCMDDVSGVLSSVTLMADNVNHRIGTVWIPPVTLKANLKAIHNFSR